MQYKVKRDALGTPITLGMSAKDRRARAVLLAPNKDINAIAEAVHVAVQTVYNTKSLNTKRAWRVYQAMIEFGDLPVLWEAARRFTPSEVHLIRHSEKSSSALGKEYGCSPSTIRMLRSGRTYNGTV